MPCCKSRRIRSAFLIAVGCSIAPLSCTDEGRRPRSGDFDSGISEGGVVSDASAWGDGQVGARDAGELDLAEAGSTENGGSAVDAAASENTTDSAVDSGAGETRDAGSALFEALVNDPELSTFVELIEYGGALPDLANGPFTLFLPTNSAFERMPAGFLDSLSPKAARELVRYHIVPEALPARMLAERSGVATVGGLEVGLQLRESIFVNGLTRVQQEDISYGASTGHKLDAVLQPWPFRGSIAQALAVYPSLEQVLSLTSSAELEELDNDGRTLFAPVSGGFAEMQPTDAGPLAYHIVAERAASERLEKGGALRTLSGAFVALQSDPGLGLSNGSKHVPLVYANIEIDSGPEGSVVHLIKEALSPPAPILDVLSQMEHDTLLLAFEEPIPGQTVSFADFLRGDGPFTVVAPTNSAFDAVPAPGLGGAIDTTLALHVVPQAVDSYALNRIEDGFGPVTLTDAEETRFRVITVAGQSLINGFVGLSQRDIPAANGIIHVADSIIFPREVVFPGTLMDALAAFPSFSGFATAVHNTLEVPDTLGATDATLTLFAPLNTAFNRFSGSAADDLTSILQGHIIASELDRAALTASYTTPVGVTAVNGDQRLLDGRDFRIDDTAIVGFDLYTRNGVLHAINGVLGADAYRTGDAGVTDASDND